jgi:DNA-binding beta-propeller fold protein YncE
MACCGRPLESVRRSQLERPVSRSTLIGFVLVGLPLIWLAPRLSLPAFGQAAPAQAPHIGEGGLPQFAKDPGWPKVPAKWKMGFGSAVAIDANDHVWILSRPHTLPGIPASSIAPPVMEFDNEGNFVQGGGGQSGAGYQWPSNEHAITVDSKGFVWIMGNADGPRNNPANLPNDNQILKFTKAGKFVLAIGKSGQTGSNATEVLRGGSGLRVYPKTNELFVSDGYGNSRVMVYDADTGKFKRMWGAYGNKPLDQAARPPRSKLSEVPWVSVAEVLQQFGSPVHDVDVSNDGLVYVSDRGNKRVQVFTPEGKFVAEQFVGLDSQYPLQARSTAFSADQRFLYVAGTPSVYILNRKTLEILGSFIVGSAQDHPPGHQIAADHKGNIYVVQAELTGADGSSGGTGAYKFVFKGYSPATKCCQGTGVRAVH